MSILINGMEMPNACIDCPLFSEWGDCSITHKWTWSDEFPLSENRMSDCPLVEIPTPHGRLIDADDVDNHIIGYVDLRECPTIIEAKGGGEDGQTEKTV